MNYLRTLQIPEGRVGKFCVKHIVRPANEKMDLANARTTLLGGQEPGSVSFPKETLWRNLVEDSVGVWMTDLPIEQTQHRNILEPIIEGSVLVGGLGLGLGARILSDRDVEITIVERSPEIIQLVAPSLPDGIRVVESDLFTFLRETKERFSWGFYDIWQSDNEGTFFDVVVPLVELSEGVTEKEPICWNEDVMRGQLYYSLLSRYSGPKLWKGMLSHEELAQPTEDKWLRWSASFFRWLVEMRPDEEERNRGMMLYAMLYGRWGWKDRWNAQF